ncbi:MAG: hypothetical protein KA224_07885 [Steroidobacteraceae bacterium]|nr:hypothetical protein [Steroidobacteraceae bacterium]MCC7198835.1 hypothetical protein [Gammaproteobacteria bacterium]
MLRSRLSLLLVLPFLVLLMGATKPIVDPAPIAVPAGMAAPAVSKVIRAALAGRGWVVDSEAPGRIEATLNIRVHTVTLEIAYDTQAVNIRYLRSTNLDEETKDGQKFIHRNYFNWLKNVQNDIARELQLAAP